MMWKWIAGALCLGFLFSCNATRVVKPLDKGEWQVGADVGGPVVNGSVLPLSGLHFAHGMHERLSFFGGLHTTALAFQTLQLDFGWCYGVAKQKGFRPGVSINTVFNPMLGLRSGAFRLYPEISPNLYWEIGEKHMIYAGMANWFDPTYGKVEIGKGYIWNPAFQLGYRLQLKRINLCAEYKLLNANKDLKIPQATVNTWTGKGAQGFYISFNYRLNTIK